jgi:phage shock protein PspC (stress-responsive transcriptional regulator)
MLYRPAEGRIVGGVAKAFAERYALHVSLVRLTWLTFFISSEIGILLYVMLWLSIPSERSITPRLSLNTNDAPNPQSRFERLSALLMLHAGHERNSRARRLPAALGLFVFGAIFYIRGGNEMSPFVLSQGLETFLTNLWRISGALLFFSLALHFLTPGGRIPEVVLEAHEHDRVETDRTETRAMLGLTSGIASTLGIETAYLRTLIAILNIFTFGLLGLIYLITSALIERKRAGILLEQQSEMTVRSSATIESTLSGAVRLTIGLLLLALALIRVATEFRFFFFNEPFAVGLTLAIIGLVLSISAFMKGIAGSAPRLWLLAGTAILFIGLYELSTTIFSVQPDLEQRFEIDYLFAGAALIFYSIATFNKRAQWLAGVCLGIAFIVLGLFLQSHFFPTAYLLKLEMFYAFFYPAIFSGAGLWLLFER